MRLTPRALLAAFIFLLPWLALLGLGIYGLWDAGWHYYGMAGLSACTAMAYLLLHWRRSKQAAERGLVETIDIAANPNWTDHDQQAWLSLEPLTAHWQPQSGVLTDAARMLTLSNEVISAVARHYHADSKYPILEFPLPYLLKLVTLVCEDLQHDVLDKIPGSHAIRLVDLLRARQAAATLGRVRDYLSIGHWLVNWPGAALAKARGVMFDKGVITVSEEISQRLLRAYIQKLGYYAIQLYSGQIVLDDWLPADHVTGYSSENIKENAANQTPEPLRLLVLGQVSSGKSSLLNAMFGDIKTAVGWLPTTARITPYVLERNGLQQAIILDSAGYAGLSHPDALAALQREWDRTDVVLIVCKATQAARAVDVQQLDAIRRYFQTERRDQALPVIIAVVTHIDQLRPLQHWQPPYNIRQPDNPKANSIRLCCESIAEELKLPLPMIVPVCLAPDRPVYNVEDGLLPLINEHLDAAQRVRYLRCLRSQKSAGYWRQWRKQMRNLGQVVLDRD